MSSTAKRYLVVAFTAALLAALVPVGVAGGERPNPNPKRDRARPSAGAEIRVNSSAGSVLLAWKPARDNVAVAGYDVEVGERRVRVKGGPAPRVRLRGFRCGESVPVRIVAFDRAGNRSRAARATVQIPGCALSMPGWFGGFDTGDLSQWDVIFAWAPERFRTTRSEGKVLARQGSHMVRVEARHNEPAPWTSGANISMAEKRAGPGRSGVLGADVYWGFSVYLPEDFPYVPAHLANNIAEWHGDNGGQAATHLTIDSIIGKHFGISNPRVGFVADLHLEPFTYNPQMWRMGDLVTGRWVDFVFHAKWDMSNGVYEGWMDGVKKFSYRGRTWPSSTTFVKPQFGYYRANHAANAVFYLDAYKIGTSYEAVAP